MTERLQPTIDDAFEELMRANMDPAFAEASSISDETTERQLGETALNEGTVPFGDQLMKDLPEGVTTETLSPQATMPTGTTTTSLSGKKIVTDDTKVVDRDR